jgi:hypothetical protein
MENKPLLVRLREDVIDALELEKDKTRISKSVLVEMAVREYFAKRGINIEQPKDYADG